MDSGKEGMKMGGDEETRGKMCRVDKREVNDGRLTESKHKE